MTHERALDALAHEPHLAQVYELERKTMNCIITLALAGDPRCHWQDYEVLKSIASRIVGVQAAQPELSTSAHYVTMLAFIDWLLPESEGIEA